MTNNNSGNYEDIDLTKRKVPKITKKIMIIIFLAGLILCSIIFSMAYISFHRQFRAQYDSDIRSIAATAREVLNPDDFGRYISTLQTDDKYNEVLRILQDFVDKFDLNLLYVSVTSPPDYTHIAYIYNPVKKGGRWREFPLGYSEEYKEKNYNRTAKLVFEERQTIVRHTFKTRSGSHITAMMPVIGSNGRVVAVIGVQKSIQEFVRAINTFSQFVLLTIFIFSVMFLGLFGTFVNHHFIRPIAIMTKEVRRFAKGGEQPSDELLKINSKDELSVLAHSVHKMEYDICENIANLTKVTAEKERMATELNLASKIQMDMLPTDYPPFPERRDFDLFASMNPAKEVGGDLYDYMMLDDDRLLICVGDVSGKGVPAALFMGKCKTLIDSYASSDLTPGEIFIYANNQLCNGNETGLFVTCWLGIFTFSTGDLVFVNAGHPSPVLYHDGKFEYLRSKPNLVLGGMEGMPYTEHLVTLSKGDRLLVYTDGVTEATDINEELFGEERLLAAVQGTENQNAPETVVNVRNAIDTFVGKAEQFDDITMLQFIWKE